MSDQTPRKVYKVRDGFHVKGDIHAIGLRIEAIQARHVTPDHPEGGPPVDEILEDARDPESPLHPNFEWDQTEAARQWNLEQARYLSRSFYAVIVYPDAPPIVINPANVVIGPREDRRIVPADVAMAREDFRSQVLSETVRLLDGVQRRLTSLRGISPEVIRRVEELKALIAAEVTEKKPTRRKQPARAGV